MLGEIAGRLAGGTILAVIMVASAVTASKSRTLRTAGVVLAIFAIGLQVEWLNTGNKIIEATDAAVFAIFFLYTALLIFRHVLSFGPVYADRVHAALSVYILLALCWAFIYGLIEILSPGAFSLAATSAVATASPKGAYLLGDMLHLSIATLTSTGYGDITPVAPFARSMSSTGAVARSFLHSSIDITLGRYLSGKSSIVIAPPHRYQAPVKCYLPNLHSALNHL